MTEKLFLKPPLKSQTPLKYRIHSAILQCLFLQRTQLTTLAHTSTPRLPKKTLLLRSAPAAHLNVDTFREPRPSFLEFSSPPIREKVCPMHCADKRRAEKRKQHKTVRIWKAASDSPLQHAFCSMNCQKIDLNRKPTHLVPHRHRTQGRLTKLAVT